MGVICHNNIIVTCDTFAENEFELVRAKAIELFGDLVSSTVKTELNGYYSFFVGTDGSKEGWPEAEEAELKRKELCNYSDTFAYEDDSSPFNYVDLEYGEVWGGYIAHIPRTNVRVGRH